MPNVLAKFVRGVTGPENAFDLTTPQVGLIGRSSVGKSSIINTLLNNKNLARTSRAPGLTREINYYKITYNGAINNSLAFDMLEGLNAGNNMTWSISVQRSIAKNLQLNLNYSGRKPDNMTTIHAGGMQLRAFF